MMLRCPSLLRAVTLPLTRCAAASVASEPKITSEPASSNSDQQTVVDPLKHPDFFGVRNMFTIEDLFRARVHFGHKAGLRNPYMVPFIFGTRLGQDIIDLEQTAPLLGDALNFVAHIAYRNGVILFVSRHQRTIPLVEKTAVDCGEYAHCGLWRLGTFTNATVQHGTMIRLPDVVVFLSTLNNGFDDHTAVVETAKVNVPSIGILDTVCDPRLITYPVPGNDDTPSAVELYCRLFKEAILRGKAKAKEVKNSETS